MVGLLPVPCVGLLLWKWREVGLRWVCLFLRWVLAVLMSGDNNGNNGGVRTTVGKVVNWDQVVALCVWLIGLIGGCWLWGDRGVCVGLDLILREGMDSIGSCVMRLMLLNPIQGCFLGVIDS